MLWLMLSAACLLVCMPLDYWLKKRCRPLSIVFKTLGTLCAVLLALSGALNHGGSAWWCVAALALCAAADALLEIHFLTGMGLFAAGHVCYCWWYLQLSPGKEAIIVFAVLLAAAFGFLYRWRNRLGKWRLPFSAYSVVLCLMGALAVGAGLTQGGAAGLLILAGGVTFVVSDVMVCRNILFPTPLWLNVVAMTVYYAAQLMLGMSCVLL